MLIIEFELFEERHKVVLDAFEKSSNLPDKGVVPVATWLVSCEGCCHYDGIDETNYEMWLMGELIELFLGLFISFNRLVITFRNEELSSLIVLLVSKTNLVSDCFDSWETSTFGNSQLIATSTLA